MGLSVETANKIFALENVLRANPGILQNLEGVGFDLGSLVGAFDPNAMHAMPEDHGMTDHHVEATAEEPQPEHVATEEPAGEEAEAPPQDEQAAPAEHAAEAQPDVQQDEKVEASKEAQDTETVEAQAAASMPQPAESEAPVAEQPAQGEDAEPSTVVNAMEVDGEAEAETVQQEEAIPSEDVEDRQLPADLSAFPQSLPPDEQQQQQQEQEEYDTQQQAQQSQQADAAALISQLSQSLLASQSQPTPFTAAATSSGFAPIPMTGGGAVTGYNEDGGQGTLLMDVLQHVSISHVESMSLRGLNIAASGPFRSCPERLVKAMLPLSSTTCCPRVLNCSLPTWTCGRKFPLHCLRRECCARPP
jgi:hypothetical protein